MPTLCALCKVNGDLKNSHIIPEFFYNPMYDSLHRFHLIPSDSAKPEKFGQKGVRERLLCGECELKFSRWENYAKQAFMDARGVKITRQKNRLMLHGIDYKTFKLFLLSLLWRMDSSTLPYFKDVRLGPYHGERLRVALLNEDPPQPNEYPCVLTAVKIDGVFHADWMIPPSLIKWDGYHVYRLLINGILFNYFVGSHPLPAALGFVLLNERNEMAVTVEELRNIPFLRDAALNFGRVINAKKKPK